ncbi:hypothetical protein J2Z60_001064 [Lactobacillus colini]|uniref:Phage protein n=1 Tax=Lactobacillus colini TaxID=1819254 RepID=A0ABS4MET2_9LACO|nr:hypothetical protein [Lactobacillus colini]MBP2057889.1 hypothetical protein [Lactobacillus colini]
MAILDDPELYSDGNLSAGKIATLENYSINTVTAGADLKFGQAVVIKDGLAVPATKAPIFGVVLKRQWTESIDFVPEEMENDHWYKGNAVDVLRDGTIAVPISEDVNENENATVDADGNFKAASAGDKIVGVFLSSGDKGNTAILQTRVVFDSANADNNSGNTNLTAPDVKQDPSNKQAAPSGTQETGK